ncbi:MAG: hypothetical protein AAFZ65_01540, partial [Planctomycetota bacterium]
VRELVLSSVATALGAQAEADPDAGRGLVQEALERVLPKPGPRRRMAECLIDGDRAGAEAARLLLELKGLPFDRAAQLERLYREANAAQIAAFEERFEVEHAHEVRDARWLGVFKGLASPLARLVGARGLAVRLVPIHGPLPFEALLDRKLRPVDRAAIESFRSGDAIGAELRLATRAVSRRNAKALAALLGPCAFSTRQELARRYERAQGRRLATAIEDDLPPSATRDLALALLAGADRRTRVAILRAAFAEVPGYSLHDALDGLDPDGRERLIQDYDTHYAGACEGREGRRLRGMFERDLRRLVRGESLPLLEQVLRQGGLPAEDLCRYYMIGLGTNEAGLLEVLRRLTRAEVEDVQRRYDRKYRIHGERTLVRDLPPGRAARRWRVERERFGWRARAVDRPLLGWLLRKTLLINGLEGDIRGEVSGDTWFDLRDALRGVPDPSRPADTRARLIERRGHELSGGLVRRWKIFRRMQARLDADLELALAYFDEHLAPALEAGGSPSPQAARRFHHLAALVLQDFDQFRAIKNRTGSAVGERLAGIGGTLGGLGFVAIERSIHGDSSIATLMLGGTVGAFLAKFVPKKLIAGDALGTEEIGIDLAHAVVEGAGRLFNRLRRLGAFAIGGLQRGVGRTAFKVGAKKTLNSVTRSVGSRFRSRRERLPELSVATLRPRQETLADDRRSSRAAVLGRELEHPEDQGLEQVFDGLLREWLHAATRGPSG